MTPPPGYRRKGETFVCRLHKSLYGLKQASQQWYSKFSASLCNYGFKHSEADHSLFHLGMGTDYVFVLLYVDDIVITGSNDELISSVKDMLHQQFHIKDLGPLKYFLGIEVARSSHGLSLCQQKYVLEILEDSGLSGARPSDTPMEQNLKLTDTGGSLLSNMSSYRRLVGRLIYLTVTRPNIAYTVNTLSQFMHQPHQPHLDAVHRLLQYLKATVGQGLYYSVTSSLELRAYCDFDWARCPMTRRSTIGYCIFIGNCPISWKTKKQHTISQLSAKEEYQAMAVTTCEITWLSYLFQDIGFSIPKPVLLFCDNQAALHIAANPVFHERTKHIEIDCHLVREKIHKSLIHPSKIPTASQVADLFTKSLWAVISTAS
ncbi:uncharacterized mitochondrial protein AtMg00810-like [Telopea speciosissima]|uniref:uncharacterized mitochondrial protein AtMg00810-like n=1 Tax=Telopea speciosissima TaxID=54955 RepID=UPI001CC57B9B|nr:uncharacterized mitochondrial protein AtMg00810-like [Telopea speciosissima]